MYALLLAIIYLAFISLGLPDSLIGAGWPVMHTDLGVPVAYAGLVTMIIAGGTIVSSLASERLTKRFGTGWVTAVSVGMTAAALLGFSQATHFWMLLVWAIPYGLGAGAVDAALNNYVALHYSSRVMSWLHGFWGIGASISPFIMGFALARNLGWPYGYLIVGGIQVVMTAILIGGLPLWNKVNPPPTAPETPSFGAPSSGPLTVRQAFQIPGVSLMLAGFLAYCAMEATTILWGATYLVQQRNITPALAATYASLYLIGITSGRFLSGLVSERMGDRGMIKYGMIVVLVGVSLIAIPTSNELVPLVGLVVAGLGSAPIYPSIIHSTPANFGKENSHGIIGIQMAAAYLGSTLAPPIFGFLAAAAGMWLFPLYLLVFAVLVLFMTQRLNRVVDEQATI